MPKTLYVLTFLFGAQDTYSVARGTFSSREAAQSYGNIYLKRYCYMYGLFKAVEMMALSRIKENPGRGIEYANESWRKAIEQLNETLDAKIEVSPGEFHSMFNDCYDVMDIRYTIEESEFVA